MGSEQIQFGPFVLDVGEYKLTRAGQPVRLERIPMDLLILLAEGRGRLVRREQIIARLWGKAPYFDADNGINTAMRKIRRALADDADQPRYIETVVGKGYLLTGMQSQPASQAVRAEFPELPRAMFAVARVGLPK